MEWYILALDDIGRPCRRPCGHVCHQLAFVAPLLRAHGVAGCAHEGGHHVWRPLCKLKCSRSNVKSVIITLDYDHISNIID